MATNYQATSDIRVLIGTEATFGTTALTGATWDALPITSFTMPEISEPVE